MTVVSFIGLDLSFMKSSPPTPVAATKRRRVGMPPADSPPIAAHEDWRGDDPWRLREDEFGRSYWLNTTTGEIERPRGSYVTSDIQPYRSMMTGEMITSKSQHREHLKRHDCIEVGNERIKAPTREQKLAKLKKSLRDDLKTAVQDWNQGKRNAPVESVNVDARAPLKNGDVVSIVE